MDSKGGTLKKLNTIKTNDNNNLLHWVANYFRNDAVKDLYDLKVQIQMAVLRFNVLMTQIFVY